MFQELRGFRLAREDLQLYKLYAMFDENLDDPWANPPFDDAHSELVKDFVCDGEKWSRELPEWLSQEKY